MVLQVTGTECAREMLKLSVENPSALSDGLTPAGTPARARLAAQPSTEAPAAADSAACEGCGLFARVHILEGYQQGEPIYRRLCLKCAAAVARAPAARRSFRFTFSLFSLAAGVLCGCAALAAGTLPANLPFFSWLRGGGVAAGALLVVIGTFLRVDLIALGGALVFCGAVARDWFPLGPLGLTTCESLLLGLAVVSLLYGVVRTLDGRFRRARARKSASLGT